MSWRLTGTAIWITVMVVAAVMAIAAVWAMPTESSCAQPAQTQLAPLPVAARAHSEDPGGKVRPALEGQQAAAEAERAEGQPQVNEAVVDDAERRCTHDYCPLRRDRRTAHAYRR